MRPQRIGILTAGGDAPGLNAVIRAGMPPREGVAERPRRMTGGLTGEEAKRRLSEFGPNELTSTRHTRNIVQILRWFANPLIIILLIASVVSAFLGQVVNAVIIVVMVLMSVALNFIQTYRSHRAAERLHDQVAPTAAVLRDGAWSMVLRREVVPGDVIRLRAGDLVPADARLLEAISPGLRSRSSKTEALCSVLPGTSVAILYH